MKKLFLSMAAFVLALSAASAYDPPLQGENLFYLSHPELMTEGVSVAGGGIESVMPASGTINPALIGLEERVSLDLGYTGMVKSKYSQAFGTGILIPTDWANFGGEMEFILDENCMGLGNSFNIKSFAAKQFMDRLYIGVGLGFGYEWTFHKDWMLTADIGAIYNFGDIAFLKARLGLEESHGKNGAIGYSLQGFWSHRQEMLSEYRLASPECYREYFFDFSAIRRVSKRQISDFTSRICELKSVSDMFNAARKRLELPNLILSLEGLPQFSSDEITLHYFKQLFVLAGANFADSEYSYRGLDGFQDIQGARDSAFCCLEHADAVLGVLRGLVQAADLGAHFFRDSKS